MQVIGMDQYHIQGEMFDALINILSDNMDDVYLMMDPANLHVEFVSGNIERVLGITRQDVERDLHQLTDTQYLTGHAAGREELLRMEPGTALEPMET